MDIIRYIGWVIYVVCTAVLLNEDVSIITAAAVVPAIIMLVGIAELISERVVKLDRALTKMRLYRGFGAITLGGFSGSAVSVIESVIIGGMTSSSVEAYPYTLSWSNDLEDKTVNDTVAVLKFHIIENVTAGEYKIELS